MSAPAAYPFNDPCGIELGPGYVEALARPGLTRVRLPFGEPAWLVTRNAEARQVLADRRFGRAAAHHRDAPRLLPRVPAGIVTMDPPDLNRIRGLATRTFTARRVADLRPHVRQLARSLAAGLAAAGPPADLVAGFALPIPIAVICLLLGVPEEDHARFRAWNDALLATGGPPEQAQAALGELAGYVLGLAARRRAEPADDLITALVAAHDADAALSQQDLVLLCVALLAAGYEATSAQIPNFVHVLLSQRDAWARLRAEPERVPEVVEELLRFVPLAAGAMFAHYAETDVEVGGTLVRAGEAVLVAIGAANRDAAAFPDPHALCPGRDAAAHLAFGHGLHRCVGAALGRVELQEALLALLEHLPQLRPAGPVTWRTDTFFRGPAALPVTW